MFAPTFQHVVKVCEINCAALMQSKVKNFFSRIIIISENTDKQLYGSTGKQR